MTPRSTPRCTSRAPKVLLLVEPTSAVDAHTESIIAERLHRARAGRTTVVAGTLPLLLAAALVAAAFKSVAVADATVSGAFIPTD